MDRDRQAYSSDGVLGAHFGVSVSLADDRAVVGAWTDSAMGLYSGSAYVFEREEDNSWNEVAKLFASDGADNDFFGFSVSLSGDRILVGAWADDDLGSYSGSAYVFEREEDSSWSEVAKLTASNGREGDWFGQSVSLSGDYALIAAENSDYLGNLSGSAYVFTRRDDGAWIEAALLSASDGAEGDHFGSSVSLSEDHAIIGAFGDDDLGGASGSAYAFLRQGNASWSEIAKLKASDGTGNDWYGYSVSLSGDRAFVGAHRDDDPGTDGGSAYVYDSLLPTAVEMAVDLPDNYHLSEPYPNPFNPQAEFSLEVAHTQQVRIEVFNTLGQRVAVLHDGLLTSRGTHPFTFDAGSLPSGVYLLRVTGETFAATRTMTLLK